MPIMQHNPKIHKYKRKKKNKLSSKTNQSAEKDHVERKVPEYENHKLRERKVKTLTRN